MTEFLTEEMRANTGKDMITGDLNARNTLWDTIFNQRGRLVIDTTRGTRFTIAAPPWPIYTSRELRGKRNPDVMIMNRVGTLAEDVNTGLL